MNFVINSDVFAKHIAVISKAQSAKNAMPILDNILIESADGKVRITASDAENYLSCELDAIEYDDNFKIALDSKKLYSSVKEIGDQPITIETLNGVEVTINYLNGKFNLMSNPANEYPENTFKASQNAFLSTSSNTLKTGLSHCVWAVANDELRPQMGGVYLDTCGDNIVMAASDGHKLVRDEFKSSENVVGASFIILPKTIGILQGMIGKDDTPVNITVAEDKSVATFFVGEYALSSRLIDRKYPNYNSVIPKDLPFVAMVDKASLRSVCSRVLVCASSTSNLLKLHFDNNTLTVSSKDIDFSTSAEEKMNIDYNASPISVGLNGDFLKQLLKEFPGETIRMSMLDTNKAVIFEPTEDVDNEKILMLLMPMMLQD